MHAFTLIFVLIASAGTTGATQAVDALDIESPRLRELADAIDRGDRLALKVFWSSLADETTPIVEPIDGDPTHVILTVVWQGDDATRNVLVVGGLTRGHPLENTMERLLDTDVWYRTYWTRNDLRATYQFSPNDPMKVVPMNDVEAVREQRRNYRQDPMNPNQYMGSSLVELPAAPKQPFVLKNPDAPAGELLSEKAFKSVILGNERGITIYLPGGYDVSRRPYPMLLLFDAETYTTLIPTPRILDNLLHAGLIPPVVAVMVGNAAGARNAELTCNDRFVDFLAKELIPWVRDRCNVSLNPAENVIAGSSFGGLMASYVAFRHPELFGNVISQSGSYWWSPDTNSSFLAHEVEGEWLTRQFAGAEKKPIRFWLEIGLNENGAPSMVIVNRHFRDVLIAKGNEIVKYDEFNGGHSSLNWRGSLADGLIAFFGTPAAP